MATIIEAKAAINTAGVEAGAQIIRDQYVSAVKVVKEQFAEWTQAQRDLDAAIANGGRNLQGQFLSMATLRANVTATKTALQDAAAASTLAKKELDEVAKGAQGAGINMRYLFFAAKDIGEGRARFAMAEIANELVRMNGAAKLAGLGLVALAAAGYGLYELREHLRGISEAAAAAAAPFRNLRVEIEETNDKMALSNAKLEDEIAKLQNKPSNGLKVALNEATVAADELGAALDKDIQKLAEATAKANVGGFKAFISHQASTTDVQELIQGVTGFGGVMQTLKDDTDAGTKAIRAQTDVKVQDGLRTALNTKLTTDYADAIKLLNDKLDLTQQAHAASPGAFGLNYTKRIEELKGVISNLESQKDAIPLRQTNTEDTTQKELLTKQKAASDAAVRAKKEATAALAKADEDELALENSIQHLSLDQLIAFWQKRLAEESKDAEREREIAIKLGEIYQSRDAAQEQAATQAAAIQEQYRVEFAAEQQKLLNTTDKQIAEFIKMLDEQVKKADESAQKVREINIQDAEVKSGGSDQLKKLAGEREYALALDHSTEAAIREAQAVRQADAQIAAGEILKDQLTVKAAKDDQDRATKQLKLDQDVAKALQKDFADETKMLTLQQAQYKKFFDSVATESSKVTNDILTNNHKWYQDLSSILTNMVEQFIAYEETRVILHIAGTKTIQNAENLLSEILIALHLKDAAVDTGTDKAKSEAQVIIAAGLAAANAYAAYAEFPPVAAAAAAEAYAATLSLGQLETGTNLVPRTGPYTLHQNEAVVPAKYNPAYGGSTVNSGGNVINNTQHINAGSGPNAARQSGAASIMQLKSFARRSNFFMK